MVFFFLFRNIQREEFFSSYPNRLILSAWFCFSHFVIFRLLSLEIQYHLGSALLQRTCGVKLAVRDLSSELGAMQQVRSRVNTFGHHSVYLVSLFIFWSWCQFYIEGPLREHVFSCDVPKHLFVQIPYGIHHILLPLYSSLPLKMILGPSHFLLFPKVHLHQ